MQLSIKTFLKIILNTLIGLVLVLIWLHFVDIEEIFNSLQQVNLVPVLVACLLFFLSPIFRAIRLKIFLAPIKRIPLLDLVFLNGFAMMLNFLIPIRGGEVAKSIYLGKQYRLPIAKSVILIFLDRFIDFLVVLILSTVLFLIIPTVLSITAITIIIFILLIALGIIYLAIKKTDFIKKLVNFLSYFLVLNIIKIQFVHFTNLIIESLQLLKRRPQELLLLFGLTILAYGVDAGIWYLCFQALGSNADFIKLYFGQLLSALTYLIPAAPGYIGSAEASGLLILSGVLRFDKNLASAVIVLTHIITTLFIIIFGVISIYFLKIDSGEILRRLDTPRSKKLSLR